MKFRTELKYRKASKPIDHESKIVLMGSCFSDHISEKLRLAGFDVLANPHGILFNPESVKNAVSDCLAGKTYEESDLVYNGEQWVSLSHHGKFSDPDPEVTLNRINDNIARARDFLKRSSHLIVTLGTSWIYRHLKQDRIVANCHKIPQAEFHKELLTVEQIVKCISEMVGEVKKVNPSMSFIFTVSPVRHLKDGIVENTLSKARLHQAVHELVKDHSVYYFPSYEIMMDDLRDYRFYDSDMIHPNATAIDYIWEKFSEAWILPSCKGLMQQVVGINRALEHRPLNPGSNRYREFRNKIEHEIEAIQKAHPQVRFIKKGNP